MGPSRAGYSPANSRNLAKIELIRHFMPLPIICKLDEDSLKNEVAIFWTTFYPLYVYRTFWLPWKPKFLPDLPQSQIQPIPLSNDGTCEIRSRSVNRLWKYSCLKVGTNGHMHRWRDGCTDREMMKPCYTISSPCESSAQVSLKYKKKKKKKKKKKIKMLSAAVVIST